MHTCAIETNLKEAGLRVTGERHRLLLLFEKPRTWTAAQIQATLKEGDLSTVYRNLRTLEERGIVRAVPSHDGEQHYERATETHHDHQVCERCQTAECVPCPLPSSLSHHLELFALCQTCQAK